MLACLCYLNLHLTRWANTYGMGESNLIHSVNVVVQENPHRQAQSNV